ncbi:hypothetical protein BJ170DRAFT_596942 [Xylariales sp. AK1849]|nr:hypothetical protein BJ170DRAFT_596942 [Xylariales sp. AK1849]
MIKITYGLPTTLHTNIPTDPLRGQKPANGLTKEVNTAVGDNHMHRSSEHVDVPSGPMFGANGGSMCVLPFGASATFSPVTVLRFSQRSRGHGCKFCGSLFIFPDGGDNDIDSRCQLTLNFVDRAVVTHGERQVISRIKCVLKYSFSSNIMESWNLEGDHSGGEWCMIWVNLLVAR